MIISGKTRDLIFNIREYSDNSLSDFNDISILLENVFFSQQRNKFLELIFKAKFLNGMLTIFADDRIEQGNKEKVSDEFRGQLSSFIDEFKEITNLFAEQQNKDFFERKYFQLTSDALGNNIRLIKDLTICKNFFLDKPEYLNS